METEQKIEYLLMLGAKVENIESVEEKPNEPFPDEYKKLWKDRGFEVKDTGVLLVKYWSKPNLFSYPMGAEKTC